MRLRLAVRTSTGAAADAVAEVEPSEPLSMLLEALARQVGVPPSEARAALLDRDERWLEPDAPLSSAGLRDGDGLLLAATAEGAPSAHTDIDLAHFEIHVTGGPAAGDVFPIPPGRHVLGRGPGAEIVIDDRSLSRRHAVFDVTEAGVVLRDAGSTNGTFVDGRPVTQAHELGAGEDVEVGRTLLTIHERAAVHEAGSDDGAGGVAFNRPPRITRPTATPSIRLQAPPEDPDGPRLPLAAAVIPLLLGAVMYVVTKSPFMLMIAALSPAMAISSWLEARRAGTRRRGQGEREFEQVLSAAVDEASAARRAEADALHAAGVGADQLRLRAAERSSELWERRPADADFLTLRLGIADLPSAVGVDIDRGGSRARREQAAERLAEGSTLSAVPVLLPLSRGFAGLAGPRTAVASLARWLVAQAAVLHSPGDLQIAAAIAPGGLEDWDWLKWLPHVRPELLAVDAATAAELVELLGATGETAPVLLVCDGALRLDRRQVAELAGRVTVIWLGEDERDLPGECTHVVALDRELARLRVTDVSSAGITDDVAADGVDRSFARLLARLLAPVRDLSAREARAEIPERVSLLDLLEIDSLSGAAVAEIWQQADERLAAPLGMAADGPFEIEVGQLEGLRLLVGGMPGAGKSELLQSMIASLAACCPPSALSFLLIDYKGGAAFRDVVGLPHTVGLVTDLDQHLADRARVSLLAELRRREALLRDEGARGLRELRRTRPDLAPAHLLIVVDEFATLGREVPAFVDTLVDVAQRGRSLGLHLVLATQRPRGAVNDTIRANTNLRVAMRMSDAGESADVIEAPDAASIPAGLPGRAIALSGRRADGSPRLVAFQTAYAGGRTHAIQGEGVAVRGLRFGARAEREERLVSAAGIELATDLEGIVDATALAAERLGIPSPPSPWLPPLPTEVALADLPAPSPGAAVIGLLDEPALQRQSALTLDLDRDGGAIIYGASRSGKSMMLRALAASLASGSSPRDVHVYVLDFASRALGDVELLPICGAVIAGDDEERVTRLLHAVRRAMAARRDKRSPDEENAPRIVLLLDGYAGFASAFDRVAHGELVQAFTRIAAEGRSLGVHVVVTADRRADVPGALAGVIPNRFVLRTADPDEGIALGLPRSAGTAELPPGRGFTQDGVEFQTAFAGHEDVARIAEQAGARHPRERAPRIGTLPAQIDPQALPAPSTPLGAVVGLDGEVLRPVTVDLADGNLLIAGAHRSGRSTVLAAIAASLRRASPGVPLHLLAPRRTPLADADGWASVATGSDACAQSLDRLATTPGPFVVVLDDGTDLPEGVGAAALDTLLRRARDETVRIVAATESHAAQRAYSGWLRELRNEQRGILLQPDSEADGELLGARLPRIQGANMPPGRGYLVLHGPALLVQIAG